MAYTLYETSSEKAVSSYGRGRWARETVMKALFEELWADGSRAETFDTLEEAIKRAEELNLTETRSDEFTAWGGVHYIRLTGACIDEDEYGETVWWSDDDRAKEWLSAWVNGEE